MENPLMPSCQYPFHFAPRTQIVFGPGSVRCLGRHAQACGGRRVLVVTDAGVARAGHADRAEASLAEAGLEFDRFDRVCENPTTQVVDDCLQVAKRFRPDLLVGLGGGSSLDTAKGCNFLLSGGGRMEDYWGVGKATRPMLPLIAVPTTAGTGSECQSFALITQEKTHAKMACGDPKAAPKVALLDPELTLTQPRAVTAASGIDALAHALETAVTRKRNAMSAMFSREAFRRCMRAFPQVVQRPDDMEARGDMLLGAALAGMAIENSMLGAAHAAANPLTARFGVPHGQAVGLMLPAVVRFNAHDREAAEIYQALAVEAELASAAHDARDGAAKLAECLRHYLALAGMAASLEELGIDQPSLGALAEEAAGQWTAGFNPREIRASDFERLYAEVEFPRKPVERTCR